jgi:hypothetical protein
METNRQAMATRNKSNASASFMSYKTAADIEAQDVTTTLIVNINSLTNGIDMKLLNDLIKFLNTLRNPLFDVFCPQNIGWETVAGLFAKIDETLEPILAIKGLNPPIEVRPFLILFLSLGQSFRLDSFDSPFQNLIVRKHHLPPRYLCKSRTVPGTLLSKTHQVYRQPNMMCRTMGIDSRHFGCRRDQLHESSLLLP